MSITIDTLAKKFRDLEYRFERLTMTGETGSLPVSTADVAAPPTDAELDAAFGEPGDLPEGFAAVVDDNGAGTRVWLVVAVGGNWWHDQMTKAL